ncbi:sulfotransferase family protein [Mycobacteroides saopaulense]|uniref:Sulfotransferase family protein n=1 Tax=Mycobacteroides saopaulense TaxID=1578165 RepID=A0A1X0IP43_9MYCO|nr:sulfotransferase family protein [Mycobacteroides saopaulense]ORB50070.1 sulfotransferase family protein [Mycobacteroides saopaulense]
MVQHGASPSRPVLLFVLGMARSGTSAITRALSLCGGALPPALAGANPANPRGYWEPRKAIILNERILHRNGSSRFDTTLRLQEEGAFDAAEKTACIAEIRAYLATLPTAPLLVVKDPRINLLSDMWFEAARLTGFDVATVIAVRHPTEVIASVAAQAAASPEFSSALWLKFNLLAEARTRQVPRVFVGYTNLLEDWRREMKRISVALGLALDNRDEVAIDEFLETDLRRQKYCGPVTEPFGTEWISVVYETLCAAACDEPWDPSALDDVLADYRISERGFRAMIEDFHRFQKLSRRTRPSMMKLIYEVMATANGRRGTWA